MKTYFYACLTVLLLSAPAAFAAGDKDGDKGRHLGSKHGAEKHIAEKHGGADKRSGGGAIHSVPEINTATAGIAIALVVGMIAVRRERRFSR